MTNSRSIISIKQFVLYMIWRQKAL